MPCSPPFRPCARLRSHSAGNARPRGRPRAGNARCVRMANIDCFQPGTNMSAWLVHHPPQPVPLGVPQASPRSRRRRRPSRRYPEIASPAARADWNSRKSAGRSRELLPDQREALILVGAAGFSREEAAAIRESPVGTIKSRVHCARARLVQLLAMDSVDTFGPDQTTQAVLTGAARG